MGLSAATSEIFCPPPALFIPEGPFIAVPPASARARAGFPDFAWRHRVWRLMLGFVNQKSSAPAALFRFFGERNGRKPHRMAAFFLPADATCGAMLGASRFRASFCRSQLTKFCGATEFACPAPRAGRPNSSTPPNSCARPQPAFSPPPERPKKTEVTSRSPTDYPQLGEAGGEA